MFFPCFIPDDSSVTIYLDAVHELTLARDPTNPFFDRHVSLREHYVVQVPKGPSMLEEKLSCPMEDAAHERQFLTAQQGTSASTFLDQHVSIVARTIDMMEKVFLDSASIFHERPYLPPREPVETAARVERQVNLLYVGQHLVGFEEPKSDRVRELDLCDLIQWGSVDSFSSAEEGLLLEQARRRRIRLYRQRPADLRVNKRIANKAAAKQRPNPPKPLKPLLGL